MFSMVSFILGFLVVCHRMCILCMVSGISLLVHKFRVPFSLLLFCSHGFLGKRGGILIVDVPFGISLEFNLEGIISEGLLPLMYVYLSYLGEVLDLAIMCIFGSGGSCWKA